jgi:hypothetical protein
MRPSRPLIVAGFVLLSALAARAQTPNISGFWLVQDTNSGSWQQWWDSGPNGHKPNQRPEFARLSEEEDARLRAGNVVNTNIEGRGRGGQPANANCGTGNLAMTFASSGAEEVTVSPTAIKLGPQTVYTDGRTHADVTTPAYKPSGNGHSTGRWDGATLVVDTVGFPAKMCDSRYQVMRLTGGGHAKETTHLTQRVRLIDADTLQIAFTWEDPSIYVEPYSYTYTFKRIPKPADDPAQAAPKRQFLTDKYWPR